MVEDGIPQEPEWTPAPTPEPTAPPIQEPVKEEKAPSVEDINLDEITPKEPNKIADEIARKLTARKNTANPIDISLTGSDPTVTPFGEGFKPRTFDLSKPMMLGEISQQVNIKGKRHPLQGVIALPAMTSIELNTRAGKYPSLSGEAASKMAEWIVCVERASTMVPILDGYYIPTLQREGSRWSSHIKGNGGQQLGIRELNLRASPGAALTGEKAVIGALSYRSQAAPALVTLFNSGFHLSIKPIQEIQIQLLFDELTRIKVELGRSIWSLNYSALSAFTAEAIVKVILNHLYTTTLPEKEHEKLLDNILVTDLYPLIMGGLQAMYPSGFPFERPCVTDVSRCSHVTKGLIWPKYMVMTDETQFNEAQIAHLSETGSGRHSYDSIRIYQQSLKANQMRERTLDANSDSPVRVRLRTPTLAEYFRSAHEWIDNMRAEVLRTLSKNSSAEERNRLLNESASSTFMRQYASYVDWMEVGNPIEDKETIAEVMANLSQDSIIREEFFQEVYKFIEETGISVVGLTNYQCPNCGEWQGVGEDKSKGGFLPLDTLQVFFTILGERVQEISRRHQGLLE